MANEKNLVPFSERTESEQRKIRSAGGTASGAARRRKRELREAADLLLSRPVPPELEQGLKKLGIDSEDSDLQMAMLASMLTKAIKGNTRAAELICSIVREDTEKQEKTTISKADMDEVESFVMEVNKNADQG